LAGVGRETAPHRVPDGREVRGSLRVLSCTLLQLSCSARHLPLLAFHPVGQHIVCLFVWTNIFSISAAIPNLACILIPDSALRGLSMDRESSDSMFIWHDANLTDRCTIASREGAQG
jgi:hypothetical protein